MDNYCYKKLFHFLLLALFISICYSNTLQSTWHFDDIPNIVSNHNIQAKNFSWAELKKSFYSPQNKKLSRPVANLTFAINYLISGLDTTSYHIFNILVHILSSWVVYLIFLHTLQLYLSRTQQSHLEFSWQDFALLGALLWAIHPIHTQAVTYIVQRMASLATLFYLLAFLCYINLRVSKDMRAKGIFLTLSLCFFLLGLGTKENTVLFPLALVGYEVAFFRTSFMFRNKFVRYAALVVFVVSFIFFLWVLSDRIIEVLGSYNVRKFSLWERLITQPIILVRYLFLIFTPLADYLLLETDMVAAKGVFEPPTALFALLFISALIVFGVLKLKKYPIICFAIFFYFANHLIESTIIPLELYFEHRNYLPSIFIFMAISYYFIYLIKFYKNKNKFFMYSLIVSAVTLLLFFEANATFLRNDIWRDEISLHLDTIDKAPANPRPYIAIAVSYLDEKQYDNALEYLKKAERICKTYPNRFQENWTAMIYYNAGLIFREKGEKEKAINFFIKSIQLDPSEWRSHVNLGILHFEAGDYPLAEDFLYNAVALHPNCPADLYNLFGRALYANAKYDEALEAFAKGLEVNEMNVLHYNRIATYLKIGSRELAKAEMITMPYDQSGSDGAYYLNRALLFPGKEFERSISKLASILIYNQDDFCEWLSRVEKNDSFNVIFPELTENIKKRLMDYYQEQLGEIRNQVTERIKGSAVCVASNNTLVPLNSEK